MTRKVEISIIIPVYNSSSILQKTIDSVILYLKNTELVRQAEVILVDDKSPDNAWEIIQCNCHKYDFIKGIRLLKNYGQHTAIYCGFEKASFEYVVTMDDDLQNPPTEIDKLISKAIEGYDLVFGRFKKKAHPLFRRLGSKFVSFLNRKVFDKPSEIVLSNFRIIENQLVQRCLRYRTNQPYIPGLLLLFCANAANISVEHHPRRVGDSNYGFKEILKLISRILFNYSAYPLRMVSYIGIMVSTGALFLGLYFFITALSSDSRVPGWSSVIVLLAILNGITLFLIGIIGEYLTKIIEGNSNKPMFFISKEINLDK